MAEGSRDMFLKELEDTLIPALQEAAEIVIHHSVLLMEYFGLTRYPYLQADESVNEHITGLGRAIRSWQTIQASELDWPVCTQLRVADITQFTAEVDCGRSTIGTGRRWS